MFLTNISLSNYRNISLADIDLQNGVNAVYGENGQGKTNLLESIFLLTGAKPFRKCSDKDLIKEGSIGSVVNASFYSEERMQQIKLTIDDKGRHISLNKGTLKKASAAVGNVCCVVFSPDHLGLVKGSPEERRKFIDTALCQTSKNYLTSLRMYTRLMSQKNNVLKDCYRYPEAANLLDVYDQQLAEAAVQVTVGRTDFCNKLANIFSETVKDISGDIDKVSFEYNSTMFSNDISFEKAIEKYYQTRNDDIRCGFCTAGPHRDDLEISIGGKSMKVYGSQGQQRTAVLALKMSEAEFFKEMTDEEPILLLDDVLSELDLGRQNDLLDRLNGRQSIITCCDPTFITGRTDAKLIKVVSGEIEEC